MNMTGFGILLTLVFFGSLIRTVMHCHTTKKNLDKLHAESEIARKSKSYDVCEDLWLEWFEANESFIMLKVIGFVVHVILGTLAFGILFSSL